MDRLCATIARFSNVSPQKTNQAEGDQCETVHVPQPRLPSSQSLGLRLSRRHQPEYFNFTVG